MSLRIIKIITVAAVVFGYAHTTNAQTVVGGNVDINAFRPAMDSRGYITVNASQVLGHKELSFGLVTNWGRGVVSFEDGTSTYDVDNVISPTLIGAVGLKVSRFEFELGLSVPFNVINGDRGPDNDGGTPADPNDDLNFQFEGQGIGDVGFHLKTRLLNTSTSPFGLAIIASIYAPTASEDQKWLGEASAVPQVMGVIDTEIGYQGRLRLAANAGIRLRTSEREFVDDPQGMTPGTGEALSVGTGIPFGGAIAYGLVPQKFDLVGEVFGELPLTGENYMPLEAIVGVKLYLATNSFLTLGGGTGLLRGKGANPDARAFVGIVFEPAVGDRDGDRIKDDVDKCPDDPEDYDRFVDWDGCPEPDNDFDGLLDGEDQCPREPEDKDGVNDDDGCPENDQRDRDGDKILDNEDECPDDPEDDDDFEDSDGCPDEDNDEDGIIDDKDMCENVKEDIDNFEDTDGCPEEDNDNDHILDGDDDCPMVDGETPEQTKEVYNNVDDEDGCPDRGRVVLTDTGIEILDKVYFEYDSDVIKKESYPILDAVSATLRGNPDILLVEIGGHTDERGSDKYNLDLSKRRAASVKRYLEGKGIADTRLQSEGYGETKPLIRKSNKDAWAKNRRVEFLILRRKGGGN